MSSGSGAIWRITALAAVPFSASLSVSVISPLLPTIRHATGMSATVGALLYAIPLLSVSALAPFAPRLARRFGAERIIAVGLALQAASMLLRSGPTLAALFCGTLLLGVSGTLGNVLAPGVIKRRFDRGAGPAMGVYSTASLIGAVVGAAATVPLMHAIGWSWRATLALWTVAAAATLLLWLWQLNGSGTGEAPIEVPAHPKLSHLYRDHLAWQVTLYYGLQNLVYSGAMAWIPSIFVAYGISQSDAGLLLAIVNLTGMVTTLTIPLLAARQPTQGRLVCAAVALLAAGLIGLLVAPVAGALLWMIIFGLGQGAAFSLALSLILLRSVDADQATELTGMTLTFGFLLGALGPLSLGAVHDLTGGWSWPVSLLLVLLLPLLVFGLGASRDRHVLSSSG